ncbi:MAG: protein kinase domain-containing protein [Burkholderiales bacterium]
MSIQTQKYGKLSEYRINKMLAAENLEQATKLRGWHSFLKKIGCNNNGVKAREEKLLALYNDLHSETTIDTNTNQLKTSSNASKLIIFVKMRDLIEAQDIKRKFRVCLRHSYFNTGTYLDFMIGHKPIYTTYLDSSLGQSLLNKVTDKDGYLRNTVEILVEDKAKPDNAVSQVFTSEVADNRDYIQNATEDLVPRNTNHNSSLSDVLFSKVTDSESYTKGIIEASVTKKLVEVKLTVEEIEKLQHTRYHLALMLQEAVRGFALPNVRNKQGFNKITNSKEEIVGYIEYNHNIPQKRILKLYQLALEKELEKASKSHAISKKVQERIQELRQLELDLALKLALEKAAKGQPVSKKKLERIQKLLQFSLREAQEEVLGKTLKAQPKDQIISSQETKQELGVIKKGDKGRRIANLILPLPPKLTKINRAQSGTYKQLTHTNEEYVGLTEKKSNPCELSKKLLGDIKDLKFIVPQYHVENNFFIAKNLNQCLVSRHKRRFIHNITQFKGLLLDLKEMHKRNIVHRDIKPENLFLLRQDAQVYLSDLDSMGYMGEFNKTYGTFYYCPEELLKFPNKYGKSIDNLCLIKSIIMLMTGKQARVNDREVKSWISFYIKPQYRKWIKLLLTNPLEYHDQAFRKSIIWGKNMLELVDMLKWDK